MKKILALILALMMMLTFVACGKGEETPADDNNDKTEEPAGLKDVTDAPVDILNNIWGKVADESKFPIAGGDMENANMEGAGIVKDAGYLGGNLYVPEAEQSKVDSVASMMHMMNANNLTVAAYHFANGSDVEAFAKTMRDKLIGNQWMCGFPEKLFIVQVGNESLIVMFGIEAATSVIIPAIGEAYSADSLKVLFEEAFPA